MPRNRRTGRRPVSGQQVHHALGKPGFQHQFAHAQRRQRRLLRRLHHHGTTRRQGRPEFPGLHQQREIPRNNLAHDAHGLVFGISEVIAAHGNRLTMILVCPSCVVAVAGDG